MADAMETKRIINLPAESGPAAGDVFVVDNENTGTKKLPVAEFVDKTLTAEGKAAGAKETGDIFEVAGGTRKLEFVNGYIAVPGAGEICTPTPTAYADRVCTTAPIAEGEELWIRTRGAGTNTSGGAAWAFLDAENIVLSRSNGSEYVQDGRYIAPAGAARVCITNIPSIEPNYYAYVGTPVNKKLSEMGAIQNIANLAFSNRIFFYQDGKWASNSGRVGTQKVYYAVTNTYIFCDSDFRCAGLFFLSEIPSTTTFTRSTGWRKWFLIPAGTYYIINMRRADEGAIYPKDAYEHLHLFASNIRNTDYVIDTSFQKRGIGADYLGLLTYWQSFCKYNGKYYCTDGSNIGIQDSNFKAISSTELSVGHGNAFQLGHNGKAYISGWDDNTVYIVDLSGDTPVLSGTISLPTTGYTTCAVDDLNGIIYIFQRDTRPNTVENYNFITYDYINQKIKSTRIINAFSAMQDLDYYEGRIAVTYGLGTETNPSGVTIYNTAGDVLAEFKLEILASNEPEGVLFDRETGDFLVTTGATVFRVDGV